MSKFSGTLQRCKFQISRLAISVSFGTPALTQKAAFPINKTRHFRRPPRYRNRRCLLRDRRASFRGISAFRETPACEAAGSIRRGCHICNPAELRECDIQCLMTLPLWRLSACPGGRRRRQRRLRSEHFLESLISALLIGISAADSDCADQLIVHNNRQTSGYKIIREAF